MVNLESKIKIDPKVTTEVNLLLIIYTVSQKTGPLLHFQITPTILVHYQQILVQRIVN